MTSLLLAYAIDCYCARADRPGPPMPTPSAYTRLVGPMQGAGVERLPDDQGCRIDWAGEQPAMREWCLRLGQPRCTVVVP